MEYALDRMSKEGDRLYKLALERIEELRHQNEQEGLGVEQTAAIRGRIAELRSLVRPPMQKVASPSYGSLKQFDVSRRD